MADVNSLKKEELRDIVKVAADEANNPTTDMVNFSEAVFNKLLQYGLYKER